MRILELLLTPFDREYITNTYCKRLIKGHNVVACWQWRQQYRAFVYDAILRWNNFEYYFCGFSLALYALNFAFNTIYQYGLFVMRIGGTKRSDRQKNDGNTALRTDVFVVRAWCASFYEWHKTKRRLVVWWLKNVANDHDGAVGKQALAAIIHSSR